MSRRKDPGTSDADRSEEDQPQSYADLVRPKPYAFDEALEAAYEPPPGEEQQSDDWDKQGRGDSPATAAAGRPTSGAWQLAARGDQRPEALEAGLPPDSRRITPAQLEVPQSVEQALAPLPRWQRCYVLALMRFGGITGLATQECRLSRESVEKYLASSPDFAKACASAVAHSTDLVMAACWRGATIGDQEPIYQGGLLVGYKRKRSHKDAEIVLRVRGVLRDAGRGNELQSGAVRADSVPAEQVGTIVASVLKALTRGHRGRPEPVEAEIVRPADKTT